MGQFTYISEPVEVEAISSLELTKFLADNTVVTVPTWFIRALATARIRFDNGHLMCITVYGSTRVKSGDWLVRHEEGDIHPCPPADFDKKYKKAATIIKEQKDRSKL